jgi:hypothetical protein
MRLRKPKQTTHDGTSKRCNGIKPHTPEQVPRAHRSLVAALSTLSAQNGIDRKGQTQFSGPRQLFSNLGKRCLDCAPLNSAKLTQTVEEKSPCTTRRNRS